MIQNTDPINTAWIQNALERMRSMAPPETMDAAVHENSRNAAQNTPVIRSPRFVAIVGDQGAFAEPSSRPPVMNGPFGNAQ